MSSSTLSPPRPSAPARTQASNPAPAAPKRVALWDNARLGLMVLVVFGHSIEGLRTPGGASTAVYDVVYAFHMPAFLLISGWFTRAEPLDRRALGGTAKLVITWLAAEGAWVGIRALLGRPPISSTFLVTPSWTLWFLVSLIAMRILLPYIAMLRWPLITTTVLALAAGLSPVIGTQFSASRTLALLPFFVLGWRMRQAGIGERDWFLAPTARLRVGAGAVLVGVGAGVLLFMQAPIFTDQLLFWRRGYEAQGFDDVTGALLRVLMLGVAAAMTLALLILVPRRSFRLSALGRNTLPVYLVHAPLVVLARKFHIDDAIGAMPGAMLILLLIAVVLVPLLASRPIAWVTRPITDPVALLR